VDFEPSPALAAAVQALREACAGLAPKEGGSKMMPKAVRNSSWPLC
jgi:hypothetical protein